MCVCVRERERERDRETERERQRDRDRETERDRERQRAGTSSPWAAPLPTRSWPAGASPRAAANRPGAANLRRALAPACAGSFIDSAARPDSPEATAGDGARDGARGRGESKRAAAPAPPAAAPAPLQLRSPPALPWPACSPACSSPPAAPPARTPATPAPAPAMGPPHDHYHWPAVRVAGVGLVPPRCRVVGLAAGLARRPSPRSVRRWRHERASPPPSRRWPAAVAAGPGAEPLCGSCRVSPAVGPALAPRRTASAAERRDVAARVRRGTGIG